MQRTNSRKIARIAAFGLAASLTGAGVATDRYWVEDIIGVWEDPAHWDLSPDGPGGDGPPRSGDVAYILTRFAQGAPSVLYQSSTSPRLDRVVVDGPGDETLFVGQDLLVANFIDLGVEDDGDLRIEGGTVDVGTLEVGAPGAGRLTLSDGLLRNTNLRVAAGFSTATGEVEMTGGRVQTTSARVGYFGAGTWEQSGGQLVVGDALVVGTIVGSDGRMTVTGGTVDTLVTIVGNAGAGVLAIDGGDLDTISMSIGDVSGPGGVVDVTAGSLAVTSGLTIGNRVPGALEQSGGIVEIGTLTLHPDRADVELTGGTLAADDVFNSDTMSFDGGVATFDSVQNRATGQFVVGTGADVRAGQFVNAGLLRQTGGTLAGGYLPPPFDLYLVGNVTNDGTLSYTGGNFFCNLVNNGGLSLSAPFELAAMTNNAQVTVLQSNPITCSTFDNAGTLALFAGAEAETSLAPLSNTGLLFGVGTLTGGLDNAGTLAPGISGQGVLTVHGPLTLETGGTLEIDLGSGGASDRLDVTTGDAVALGGVLHVASIPSDLAFGDTYRILDAPGPIVGAFDAITGPAGGKVEPVSGGAQLVIAEMRSDFESGTDGWTFTGDVEDFGIASGGPCGDYLTFTDQGLGPVMVAHAPARFEGDWSAGDGRGSVRVKFGWIANQGGGEATTEPLLSIEGPGGRAVRTFDPPALGAWTDVAVNLDASEWTVLSGTWAGTLANVTSFWVSMEWRSGLETTGLDEVVVSLCERVPTDPADVNRDGVVDFGDLLLVLAAWGACADCPEDVTGDGFVDFDDVLRVLASWT